MNKIIKPEDATIMKKTFLISIIAFTLLFTACEDVNNDVPRGTWNPAESGITERLNDITFSGENNGWIVGNNNTVLKTTDGVAWERSNINDGNTYNFLSVTFTDNQNGYIGGEDLTNNVAVIFRTRNGGSSWNRYAPEEDISRIKKIAFSGGSTGYALGGNHLLLKTTNAGSSWSTVHTFDDYALEDIAVSGANIWACGRQATVFFSSDAGSLWMNRNTPDSDKWLMNIFFLNNNTGYAATAYGDATLYKTDDGGTSWQSAVEAPEDYISDIFFTDENNGWITAENNIYFTTNGTDWETEALPVTSELNALAFPSGTRGYAVGYNGTILHFE